MQDPRIDRFFPEPSPVLELDFPLPPVQGELPAYIVIIIKYNKNLKVVRPIR